MKALCYRLDLAAENTHKCIMANFDLNKKWKVRFSLDWSSELVTA